MILSYANGTLLGSSGPLYAPDGPIAAPEVTEIPVDGPPPGQSAPSEPPAPAPGKGQSAPPKATKPPAQAPGKGKPAAPSHFHKWVGPDGREHTFADQKELNEFLTKSHMFQSDYSRKSEENKRMAERIRQREKELEKQAEEFKKTREQFASFDKARSTHPDAFKKFADSILAPPSPDESYNQIMSALDERFKPLEERLNDLFSERQFNEEQEKIFSSLSEEFPDLNRGEVEEFMSSLVNDPIAMTRAMVHAMQHRKSLQSGSPEQEQLAAEAAAAAKRNGRMLPGGAPSPAEVEYASVEEARRAGINDARAQGL